MLQVKFTTKPQNRAEIGHALAIRCAERGTSRSTFAVKELGIAPSMLAMMLRGTTNYRTHLEAAQKVCDVTGADLTAWES